MRRFYWFLISAVIIACLFIMMTSGTVLAHEGEQKEVSQEQMVTQDAWGESEQDKSIHPYVFCEGIGCTGRDPFKTACASTDASARVLTSVPLVNASNQRGGTLELWYSDHCQTNWARVIPLVGDVVKTSVQLTPYDNPNNFLFYGVDEGSILWTALYYAPVELTQAFAAIQTADGGVYIGLTAWY